MTQNDENNYSNGQPWYQKNWFIISMIFLFYPVGLVFMWLNKNWEKYIKVTVTSVFIIFTIIGVFVDHPVKNNPNNLQGVSVTNTTSNHSMQSANDKNISSELSSAEQQTEYVWVTRTGKKYHSISNCGSTKSATQITLQEAKEKGLTPCAKCY